MVRNFFVLMSQETLNFPQLSFPFLAVIFPTLWEYLRSFGVAENKVYWLGLVISAATVSDMFGNYFKIVIVLALERTSFRRNYLYTEISTAVILIVSAVVPHWHGCLAFTGSSINFDPVEMCSNLP